ncbi:MAG TPA: hypothetical protein VES68_00550 [Candidatus Sulfotelmatobacter sp.]|nr:hypothetical protein [Candidatus Sulfotelmatobacter sp.]
MPSDNIDASFSKLSTALIKTFENEDLVSTDKKISVNILISKVASFYEKVRTAMDYGGEETILRRAIERILKRMLLLNENSKALAENLVRELIWAGYFKDATDPESIIERVSLSLALYLKLKDIVLQKKLIHNTDSYQYILQLLSCEIDTILLPNREKEAISNYMFQILKDSVEIVDDSEQTRDVQVFIAIRKNFAKDDLPFLRYKLFTQIFGRLTEDNFDHVVSNFSLGYKEIEYQLSYPRKDRVFNHVKKITPAFLILHDLLMEQKKDIKRLVKDEDTFKKTVFLICDKRYNKIENKVRTAIIRSFVFILFTKAFIALFIEGTFERIFFGAVQWLSIILNTIIPPILMVIVGLEIKIPDSKNSQVIYLDIRKLLFDENPKIINKISLKLKKNSAISLKDRIFSILWLLSIGLVLGLIGTILGKLHFNILSQGIFIFFITIVSFLTYRIYQTANTYRVIYKQNLLSPIVDFFFVPIIRVGRSLTEGIAQINFILIVIDFIIETPFKGIVGFFEQWFSFLATKREELE